MYRNGELRAPSAPLPGSTPVGRSQRPGGDIGSQVARAVIALALSESWRVERDRPAYVAKQNKAELEANLEKAPRTI